MLRKDTRFKIYKTQFCLLFATGMKLSCTSREKHRLRVYRNRVMGRIIGPKREDGNKGVEKTAYEKLHDL